ncbi:MAG: lipid-A-disaccharide synthase [Planctomycetaceae bacterium]|nr:lipid-A-disaccharide synthase [Planctomycetaceae bacterium]
MKIFFSAGEPSGDIHAAALIETIKKLAPDTEFVGFGGPKMEQAGCRLITDMTQFAFMWLSQVIKQYFHFRKLFREAKKVLHSEMIDLVVLVDYPGFNWHIAKAAKDIGIPVVYFMPPQVWAWAQHRVKKLRNRTDLVLCSMLFEWKWFKKHGCKTVYIGHPFFEEIRKKQSDPEFLESFYEQHGKGPVLTILTGSRNQEVEANLNDILSAVKRVQYELPNVQPVFAAFNELHASMIRRRLTERKMSIPVFVGKTTELIRAADCCIAVSGSVSLELLACNKPSVIYFRVGRFGLFLQRFFRRTRHITLVNMLGVNQLYGQSVFFSDSTRIIPREPNEAERNLMLFPEFLTSSNRSSRVADWIINYLSQPKEQAEQKQRLEMLLHRVDVIESPLELAAKTLLASV